MLARPELRQPWPRLRGHRERGGVGDRIEPSSAPHDRGGEDTVTGSGSAGGRGGVAAKSGGEGATVAGDGIGEVRGHDEITRRGRNEDRASREIGSRDGEE
jgi:hypothetical protein